MSNSTPVTINGALVSFDPLILVGPQGNPGVLVLGPTDPVPAGTPSGTIIFRRNS